MTAVIGNSNGILYDHNGNIFSTWTESSAYLLGYLAADGTIVKREPSWTFIFCSSIDDLDYMEQLKQIAQYNGPIYQPIVKVKGKEYGTARFSITSRRWKQDLANWDRAKIPDMPEDMVHHYIRGYFDGDGSVYFDANRIFVSFVFASLEAAEVYLDAISKVIGMSKGMRIYKKINAECWYFRIAKQTLVARFSDWLYKDASIFLQRKKDRFNAGKVG